MKRLWFRRLPGLLLTWLCLIIMLPLSPVGEASALTAEPGAMQPAMPDRHEAGTELPLRDAEHFRVE